MTKLPVVFLVLFVTPCFSQQRIGLELFSHLDDLSLGTHYQKVVYSKFIVGAGLIWINKRRGEAAQEQAATIIHTAIRNVPEFFERGGEKYLVQGYYTISKSLMLTLNTGFFHEFDAVHGVRVNLNVRMGIAQSRGFYSYRGMVNDTIIPVKYVQNHLVTAVCPEMYHTLRQRSRLTFYYGLRFPVYFSLNKRNFDPVFRKDGFYRLEMEGVIGATYFIGRAKSR